jgi:hypothetical protein
METGQSFFLMADTEFEEKIFNQLDPDVKFRKDGKKLLSH